MRYAEVTDMKRNTSQDDFTFCYYDQNHVKYLLLI